jgi:hypothetical protein
MDEVLATRPRPATHVDWVELDGEVVLFNERTAQIRVLNATAGLIWRLLDGQVTVGHLAHEIATELDVDEAAVRADATRLVRQLASAHLLEV